MKFKGLMYLLFLKFHSSQKIISNLYLGFINFVQIPNRFSNNCCKALYQLIFCKNYQVVCRRAVIKSIGTRIASNPTMTTFFDLVINVEITMSQLKHDLSQNCNSLYCTKEI